MGFEPCMLAYDDYCPCPVWNVSDISQDSVFFYLSRADGWLDKYSGEVHKGLSDFGKVSKLCNVCQ